MALHRLQHGTYGAAIVIGDEVLELAPDTTVDVLESVRLAAQGDLDGAVAASTAEFMPWLEERDVPPDGWLAQQRRRWTETYVDLLRRAAADAEAAGDLPRARRHAAAWVAVEPRSEAAHRAGLRLAVIAADGVSARRLWSDCEAMTTAVHDRPPAASTRAWLAAVDPSRNGRPRIPTWPITGRAALLAELRRSRPVLLTTTPGSGGSQVLTELARSHEHRLLVLGRAAVGPLVCFGVALSEAGHKGRHTQHALAALAGGDSGERTRALFVAAVLETIGSAGALLLDDMHLFDQASLDVVAGVLRTVERAPQGHQPTIVGAAFRQDLEHEPLAGWLRLAHGTHRMRIERLDPLTRSDVAAILTHVLGAPPSRDALAALWEISAGYPGFVDLALRNWAAAGVLLPDDSGGWTLEVERARTLPLPKAAVDLIRSRIDALDRRRRRILEVCLCLDEASPGEPPDGEVVMTVTGESRWDVVEALEHLERAGFTRDGVSQLGPYAQPMVAGIPRETYRAIHRALSETLSTGGTSSDRVARHLSLAGDDHRAARHWLAHADWCRRRLRWEEALETWSRAIDLGLSREDELTCRLDRFDVLTALGDPRRAREELVTARALAATPAERVLLRVREARVHLADGAYDAALATVDGVLEQAPGGDHVPEAHLLRGMVLARVGRLDEARAALGRCREQHSYDDVLRDQEAARALVEVEMAAARYEAAAALLPELERLTSLAGYPHIAALSEGTLARYHAALGDDDGALDHAARWISLAREHGFRGMEALALVLHASIRLGQGDCAGSLASFVAALGDITPDHRAVVQANIGTCYLQLGQVARAFAHYDAAITDAELRGEPHTVMQRHLTVAEAKLRHGVVVDLAELATLREQDADLGRAHEAWITELEAHAAALRGDLDRAGVAAVEALPTQHLTHAEAERRDHVLALGALVLGDPLSALVVSARRPDSMRLVAIKEVATGLTTPFDGSGSAVDQLLLAHVRGLNGSKEAAADAVRRRQSLEEAWPPHDEALRRLLALYTRAHGRRSGTGKADSKRQRKR